MNLALLNELPNKLLAFLILLSPPAEEKCSLHLFEENGCVEEEWIQNADDEKPPESTF